MQKVVPFLWFDKQAEEAVNFYISLFNNSKIGAEQRYDKTSSEVAGMPEGSLMTVDFTLDGFKMAALNGGPIFKITPAISFSVTYSDEKYLDSLWEKLADGGTIRMEYSKYPFSEKYGWVEDKYGVNWQLSLGNAEQKIIPSLLFVGNQYGNATAATNMYIALFENSGVQISVPYEKDEEVNGKDGAIKYSKFSLSGQDFIAMDSNADHKFTFTEGVSLLINCKDQEEIDKFWKALAIDGEEQPCGWVKDKYGVSWQVVPENIADLLKNQKVVEAMFKMKKLVIADLVAASQD